MLVASVNVANIRKTGRSAKQAGFLFLPTCVTFAIVNNDPYAINQDTAIY